MFIETDEGRLQNLYLLQNVLVGNRENDETSPYCIDWVQSNGLIIKEGEFATESAAETKREEIVNKLLISE